MGFMERGAWTDERLDERMTAVDTTFDRLHTDLDAIRGELAGMRQEFTGELRGMRSDLARVQDRMIQIGFGLVAALLAALVTAILALA